MANRNTLATHKLDEFKAWLDANAIEHRPTTADWQVLQVRLPGETRWHAIYQKLDAKQHLSVPLPLERLLRQFITGETRPAVSPSMRHRQVYGADLDTTPPWD